MAPSRITRTILFTERLGMKKARDVIDAFFGTDNTCDYNHFGAGDNRVRNALWCVIVPGKPTVNTVDERWIDVTYDNDSYCGQRNEPYVMVVTTRRQDPFTCAIADGLTAMVVAELGGVSSIKIEA